MSLPSAKHNHSPDAECGLLASLIMDGGGPLLAHCAAIGVGAGAFYEPVNGTLFSAIAGMAADNVPIDDITLCERLAGLPDKGRLPAGGWAAYIASLTQRIEVTAHAPAWAAIVRDKWHLRLAVHHARKAAAAATAEDADPSAVLAEIEESAVRLRAARENTHTVERLSPSIARLRLTLAAFKSGVPIPEDAARIVGWGVPLLDKEFAKLNPLEGDLLVTILGMSSHGKSAFARNLVVHNLLAGKRCAVFSLETTPRQFVNRAAATLARFDAAVLRRENPDGSPPSLSAVHARIESDVTERSHGADVAGERAWRHALLDHNLGCYSAWLDYLDTLADQRLHVFSTYSTIDDITSKIRDMHRAQPLSLVVVDYLQLVVVLRRQGLRGDEIIKEIVSAFKSLAARLTLPIFLISSITAKESTTTPDFTDARGSQEIAYGSDRSVIVFRPTPKPDPNAPPLAKGKRPETVVLKIKQAKARDLPIAEVPILFNGRYSTFLPVPKEESRGRPPGALKGHGKQHVGSLPPGVEWPDTPLAPFLAAMAKREQLELAVGGEEAQPAAPF
jgi:replicative DNA helicase